MPSISPDQIMEEIHQEARRAAAHLSETVAAATIDFIVSTSLQILPLAQRNDPVTNTSRAALCEKSFINSMRRLALALASGLDGPFEVIYRVIVGELEKTRDGALVDKFARLVRLWKTDGLQSDDKQTPAGHNPTFLVAADDSLHMQLDQRDAGNRSSSSSAKHTTKKSSPRPQVTVQQLSIRAKNTPRDTATADPLSSRDNPPSAQHIQPCEANDFGVETRDGVLVGYPPAYPPALLDWEADEVDEEMEELVSIRRARTVTHAPLGGSIRAAGAATRSAGQANGAGRRVEDHELGAEDDWVHLDDEL